MGQLKRTHKCQMHVSEHRPRCSDTDIHHMWPKEFGGIDDAVNQVETCPTGHRNLHELLREYLHAKGDPGWEVKKQYHPAERDITERVWRQMVAAGKVDEVRKLARL